VHGRADPLDETGGRHGGIGTEPFHDFELGRARLASSEVPIEPCSRGLVERSTHALGEQPLNRAAIHFAHSIISRKRRIP
jgi:hypothetical protein